MKLLFWVIVFLIVIWGVWGIRVVKEWERLAILTLGHYSGLKGPGLVIVWPVAQTVASRIDMRVVATSFQSETTLTKDSVAVTVKAVLFWRVVDPEKATLAVEDYRSAVQLAAQTSMRDAIGRTSLADILSNLQQLDALLKETISAKAEPWGIQCQSVEIRDVAIPNELQDAMSRAAQAEREKQARIIYGEAEAEAAQKFVDAARIYLNEPVAVELRAMSIMYE
ncbi:MAG TPA: slipin family protein, partial [Spirochaetia bacterium]|nr:slipin family protein [Spirochaetia bacterium]